MGHIFSAKGFTPDMLADPDVKDAINETCRILTEAVDSAFSREVPRELIDHLHNDTFLFSGFKTYHEAREISALLLDNETGTFKSFEKFLDEVREINSRYNSNYLQAEYNFAVQSTQMAVKWHDFQHDGDRYLLQYRTANDGLVRPEHQALHNTTLPIDDPFWDSYTPPLGWNCRCTVVQVNRGKYPVSDSAAAIRAGEAATAKPKQQIFRFNPGKTQTVFPPKHPYYKVPEDVKKAVSAQSPKKEVNSGQDIVSLINDNDKSKAWFERGLTTLDDKAGKGCNGSTDMNGTIHLTQKRLDNCISAIKKLNNGEDISFDEADSMATLWHEITHNRNKQGNMWTSKLQTDFMELANEFVARKSLPEFYEELGFPMQHPEFMTNRASTGYNRWVNQYEKVISATGCDTDKIFSHVRTHLFDESYKNQKQGLIDALANEGAHKNDGTPLKKTELGKLVSACLDYEYRFNQQLESLVMN